MSTCCRRSGNGSENEGEALAEVRELAREGVLAERLRQARSADRTRLYQALYRAVWPIVFDTMTRGIELRRGHMNCAQGLHGLNAECLDKFHDDVAAVVDGAIRRGSVRVQNLEAWIATILNAATVDGYRRRRGERGALQRPRVPKWLANELAGDDWLLALAVRVLVWVGLPGTAGADLWPFDSWAEQRAAATGDCVTSTSATIRREVEYLLNRMRTRPEWFEAHVERPLGFKQIPTASTEPEECAAFALVRRHELDDAHLAELARTAIKAIDLRLHAKEDARAAVSAVIRQVFCGDDASAWFDRAPQEASRDDEWLAERLKDEIAVSRITSVVFDILAERAPLQHRQAS
jgi:hypothetical protein